MSSSCLKGSAYYVNAYELLAGDDELCGRQLLFVNRRENRRRVAAAGAIRVERCDDRRRQVRQLASAYDSAVRDAEEFHVETVALLHFVDGVNELAQILRDESLGSRAFLKRAAV